MVFSSYIFLFGFLPLALALYFLAPARWRNPVLTVLSYAFYAWSEPRFAVLMLLSTCIDYWAGRTIAASAPGPPKSDRSQSPQGSRSRPQKIALAVSILANLSLLGFFKYFNLAQETWSRLLAAIGVSSAEWDGAGAIALPLGISFYTFQSMSYTIDVYRGRAQAVDRFADFACFVSMFPQLVAGPIVRFRQISGQLKHRRCGLGRFARGAAFLSLGLGKKVLLADPCGHIADLCFEAAARAPSEAWLGACAYAFQIYFDFSGYSDMAVGLGLMPGFRFPRNFNRPYLSESITEFWRRWHLSLSQWLRDYLYLPLGGNRKGNLRTYANLTIVMLLGGMWHGAGWNFLAWGAFHGLLLALERAGGRRSLYPWLPAPLRKTATFGLVLFSWSLFRASDLEAGLDYLADMLWLRAPQAGAALLAGAVWKPYYLSCFLLSAAVVWGCSDSWEFLRKVTVPKSLACLAVLLASLAVLTARTYSPFIYFIF